MAVEICFLFFPEKREIDNRLEPSPSSTARKVSRRKSHQYYYNPPTHSRDDDSSQELVEGAGSEHMLWVDKYSPHNYTDLLSDDVRP